MTVAAIERFADPSRRYDAALAGTADAVETVELPDPFRRPGSFLRALPRSLADWARVPRSMRDRADLARAALATGGARLGALLVAPGLLRRARAGDWGGVACQSARDFALARHLAREAGVALDEGLARGTQYYGEFAFELLAVVPYAHWLHRAGRLAWTASTADTRALYPFSPRHVERDVARRYVPITEYPSGVAGRWRYDRKAFPPDFDTSRWSPPPYRDLYAPRALRFGRPTAVVCNKATDEHYRWHRAPANFIPTGALLELVGGLRERFQVVYVRPQARDIVHDHQALRERDDIDAVRSAFPDVLTIQQLHERHPESTYNELQMRLFAGCERFVSVLGGSAYLASYFGGVNVVYARRGWEVDCGAYDRWFDRFSGARVSAVAEPRELLAAAATAFG